MTSLTTKPDSSNGSTLRPALGTAARVLGRRALQAAGVVVLVSTACFAIVQSLPGDIAFRIAAGRYGYDQVTAASADNVRAELGLDQPGSSSWTGWAAYCP
jgi:peptide/nickel transport system permease protein